MNVVKVMGIDQVIERLKTLPAKVEKKILRRVLRKGAKPIAKAMKAKAPKDTGELQKRIGIRAKKRSRKAFGVRVDARLTGAKNDISARDVEFGHRVGTRTTITIGEGKHKREIGTDVRESVQPRPFARPAFDQEKGTATDIIGIELGRLIEEEASGKPGDEGESFDPKPAAQRSRRTRKPKQAN